MDKLLDYLDGLDDSHDTPGRFLAWLFLAMPFFLLHSLTFGLLLALFGWIGERKEKPAAKSGGWFARLDPRFRAMVRVGWVPYLAVLACLVAMLLAGRA